MAALTALQRLMASPKTARFVETLRHSDLPVNWADDPEIVGMAGDAYKELGTGSPFFKATFGNSKVVDGAGNPQVTYHGTKARKIEEFSKNKIGKGASKGKNLYGDGFYFTPDYYSAQTYGKNVGDYYLNIENPSISGNIKPGQDGIMVNAGFHPTYVALEPTQIKSVSNRGTFNPADPNIYRGLIPMLAGGGALAATSPGSAQASEAEWPKQGADGRLVWPADMPGYRNTEPGLEAPLVDPVDIATAPIGMTTAAGKALAMAAEPGIAYGTDKALGALLGLFQRNRRTGGGGGV